MSKKKITTEELKMIASQLGCPEGEQGIKTAEKMAVNNAYMTESSINFLELEDNEVVLEIGPGNASHLKEILSCAKGLKYVGLDISQTMLDEAEKINQDAVKKGTASFALTDGSSIPFPNHFFNKIFTVNTVYFWKDPIAYLREIHRVMRPGGVFCLTFADKDFMETLPFTAYGFTLYDENTVKQLLLIAGFSIIYIETQLEKITSNSGDKVERTFYNVIAEIQQE